MNPPTIPIFQGNPGWWHIPIRSSKSTRDGQFISIISWALCSSSSSPIWPSAFICSITIWKEPRMLTLKNFRMKWVACFRTKPFIELLNTISWPKGRQSWHDAPSALIWVSQRSHTHTFHKSLYCLVVSKADKLDSSIYVADPGGLWPR